MAWLCPVRTVQRAGDHRQSRQRPIVSVKQIRFDGFDGRRRMHAARWRPSPARRSGCRWSGARQHAGSAGGGAGVDPASKDQVGPLRADVEAARRTSGSTEPYWHRAGEAGRYTFDADAPFGLPYRPTPFYVQVSLGCRRRVGGRRDHRRPAGSVSLPGKYLQRRETERTCWSCRRFPCAFRQRSRSFPRRRGSGADSCPGHGRAGVPLRRRTCRRRSSGARRRAGRGARTAGGTRRGSAATSAPRPCRPRASVRFA